MSKDYKADGSAGKVIKVACEECEGRTNHKVLKSVEESGSERMGPYDNFYWRKSFEIVQCMGCETVSFRSLYSNSEDCGPDGEADETEQLFPSRERGRNLLPDLHPLPAELARIYRETVAVLNAGHPVLAGVGIRAIVETITKDKRASGDSLSDRINGLVSIGVLTADGAKILHKIRTLGNDAAHEVKAHGPHELGLALDVVEHLLQAVYILPVHAQTTFK